MNERKIIYEIDRAIKAGLSVLSNDLTRQECGIYVDLKKAGVLQRLTQGARTLITEHCQHRGVKVEFNTLPLGTLSVIVVRGKTSATIEQLQESLTHKPEKLV